ncbi:MAG: electron transfer flavoprotein subunit beta/FixA family protein, partial [Chloroflexi bacterium]|nr:electron transfer flavoprotein subunit beta/FixA family protein [Chloroflexota bacterium]
DEFGVELAVQLKEKRSDVSEVVALTLGPDRAGEALRVSLAMGADSGIHLNDPKFESKNELFAAFIIAEAIKRDADGFDLILCGKYNIDLDAGAVGPALAEFLDIPHVGAVTGLDISDDGKHFTARRRIEGAEEIVETKLPALLTCEKGLVEPRFPSLPKLMKAKKQPIETISPGNLPGIGALATARSLVILSPPPPRPACTYLEGEPREMARDLVRRLRQEGMI